MFLGDAKGGYTRDGSQWAVGSYLMVSTRTLKNNPAQGPGASWCSGALRALVRRVRLSQLGPWMMGSLQVDDTKLTVSGGLGSDGLPMDVPDWMFTRMMIVPDEIARAMATDQTGHNTPGVQAHTLLRPWALENLKLLRRAGGPVSPFYDDGWRA